SWGTVAPSWKDRAGTVVMHEPPRVAFRRPAYDGARPPVRPRPVGDLVRAVGAIRALSGGGTMDRPTAAPPRPIRWRRRRAVEHPGPATPAGEEISPHAAALTATPRLRIEHVP